jgi:endonuclease VIII
MPEGPSIILLKEAAAKFAGKKIIAVSGNSKIDQGILLNKRVNEIKSWGKHFLICLEGIALRVHFLMFGSYTIDERKPDRAIRLNLTFENGEINFYSCSLKYLEGDINSYYDWSADVMNPQWNKKKAKAKLKASPGELICDALLEQDIFAGVGNIIKNEILYRVRIHPESITAKIPGAKINTLIDETRNYSFQFLEWKRAYELKKNWLAHTKKLCLRCNLPIIRKQTGLKNRRSFFCTNCQILYS